MVTCRWTPVTHPMHTPCLATRRPPHLAPAYGRLWFPRVEDRGESRWRLPAGVSRRGRLSSDRDAQCNRAGSQHDVVAIFATRFVLCEHACAIAEVDPHRSRDIAAQSGNQARAALTQRHFAALAAQAIDAR